jgi:hypothetical protein
MQNQISLNKLENQAKNVGVIEGSGGWNVSQRLYLCEMRRKIQGALKFCRL